MSLDDVLIAVIVGGIGLSGAYFRGEYILWRKDRATELRKEISMRKLHIDPLPIAIYAATGVAAASSPQYTSSGAAAEPIYEHVVDPSTLAVHADCEAEGQNLAARHIKDRE
jgi:hypothetical protein